MSEYIEVLDSIRAREVSYKGCNLYPVLSFDSDGFPCALTLSISGQVINNDQATLSNIDGLAVMVSLALREMDHDYVAAKLAQVARGKNTLPSIIAEVLMDHGGDRVRSQGIDMGEE